MTSSPVKIGNGPFLARARKLSKDLRARMLPDIQRTIVALASPPRPAERAIIRLAGPDTRRVLAGLCPTITNEFLLAPSLTWCQSECQVPSPSLRLPVIVLYWPNDRSYTGSPAAEIHMIGCVPLAEAVINRCCELGADPAQRGEFTLRAFLAGKLDLAQAEAVLGVIEADTPASLRTALSQLGGNLAPAIAPLRNSLIDIVAELEAGLDFVDEDIQFISQQQVVAQLESVSRQLDQFAARLDTRSSSDRVPQVVLTGVPNSGKSSLFNAISRQPLAIVADVPGTTRDYLQHRIRLPDVEFDLIDTAGWEELQGDTPRAMAQTQLARCLAESDLALLCIDVSQLDKMDDWKKLAHESSVKHWLVVGTKIDLVDEDTLLRVQTILESIQQQLHDATNSESNGAANQVITSINSDLSIDQLMQAISRALSDNERRVQSSADSGPLAVVHETAVRCRAALAAARTGIAAALETARDGGGEELIAAELRLVLDDLATIIGEVHSDDVLGEIFSRFCIGK